MDKIEQLKNVVEFLSKEINGYNRAAYDVGDLSRCKNDWDRFNKFILLESSGAQWAEKYDMMPGGKLGKYIDDLEKVDCVDKDLTKIRMIMLIFSVGILYGRYEYLKELGAKKGFSYSEQVAMDRLTKDVDYAREHIVQALDILSNKSFEKIEDVIQIKNVIDNQFDILCHIEVEKKSGTIILDYLSRYLLDQLRFLGAADYVTYNSFNMHNINNVSKIISIARKNMGDNYVIARSTNLWTEAVLKSINLQYLSEREKLKIREQKYNDEQQKLSGYFDMMNLSKEFIGMVNDKMKTETR
jgi:hypothetical protein